MLGAVLPAPTAPSAPAAGRSVHQPGTHLRQRPLLFTQPARPRLQSRERPIWVSKQLGAYGPNAFGPLRYAQAFFVAEQ